MKLINNDDTLRQYLPNVFATVKGEVSLFDKVKVDIDLAENWVIETFVSSKTFNTVCGYVEDNPIKIITAKLIASEALRRAILRSIWCLLQMVLEWSATKTSLRHRKNVLTVLLPRSPTTATSVSAICCRHLSVRVSGSLPRRLRSSVKRCFPTSPLPTK